MSRKTGKKRGDEKFTEVLVEPQCRVEVENEGNGGEACGNSHAEADFVGHGRQRHSNLIRCSNLHNLVLLSQQWRNLGSVCGNGLCHLFSTISRAGAPRRDNSHSPSSGHAQETSGHLHVKIARMHLPTSVYAANLTIQGLTRRGEARVDSLECMEDNKISPRSNIQVRCQYYAFGEVPCVNVKFRRRGGERCGWVGPGCQEVSWDDAHEQYPTRRCRQP